MRSELENVLTVARQIPAEQLPRLIGDLEEIRCTAMARLSAPPVATAPHDELLSIDRAASRLGMSRDYLYRHSKTLPFTQRVGRSLRFSSNGIDQYIKQARGRK